MLKLCSSNAGVNVTKTAFFLGLLLAGLAGGLHADEWSQQVKAAVASQKQGDLKGAEKQLLSALMTAEKFEDSDPRAAYTLDYLGTLYQMRKMDDEALRVYEQALKGFDKSLGPNSEESRSEAQRLAEACEATEHWDKSEPLRRRLLAVRRADPKAEPIALAQDISDLALSLDAQKKWDEAMTLYDEVLRLRENALGPWSTEVAETLNNQGRVHLLRGELKAAEDLLRRALSVDQKALGMDHSVVADDRRRLAAVLKKAGRAAEAEEQETLAAAADAAAALRPSKTAPQPTPKAVPRPGAQ